MKSEGPERLGERTLYVGRVFRLLRRSIRLASGKRQDIDVVQHPGAVAIAARDARGRMLLVRQFRAALEIDTLEVPAGRVEAGESPLACAKRELEEETGMRADHWRPLRTLYPAPGFCSEVIRLFEARDLHEIPGGGAACDDDEELETVWKDPAEILAMDPVDSKTFVCAWLMAGDPAGRERDP